MTNQSWHEKRVIAIDGPAGSGKSTVAKALAQELGLAYLDTGAMYRSVAFAVLRAAGDPDDADYAANIARNLDLQFDDERLLVNGVDATLAIRGPEVTRAVSVVAANPLVRRELVSRQREWIERNSGGVLEGRDIGTVVYPEAELKVYLNADPSVRARRRAKEVTGLDYQAVAADLARRDTIDSSREFAPLSEAADAVVVDTSKLTVDEVVSRIVSLLTTPTTTTTANDVGGDQQVVPKKSKKPYLKRYGSQSGKAAVRSRQGWPGRVLYRFLWSLLYLVSKGYFRLQVEGKENLPEGPFVLSSAHRSFIDTPIVGVITSKRLRFMGKESLWESKTLGAFLTLMGGFPVDRGGADRTALRAASDVLCMGEPLVMFPEGTRQTGARLDRRLVHNGPAFVAARAQVPIVPVGLGGTPRALSLGSKIPRPAKVVAIIGEPIAPPAKVAGKVPRHAVTQLTEKLYRELADLFVEARVAANEEPPPSGLAR